MKTVSFDESEWQLVPVEATEEMLEAGFHAIEIGGGVTEQAWAALLAAAPTQAESPADVARDAELLRKLRHSIRQAMIPGNDWRRELALMNGAIDAAMSEKGGA